ncbi:MAG: S8 family serine peptidase [Streptosporangiaceae bacterium]
MIGLASAPLSGFVMLAHADTWRQSEWWLTKQHVIQAWRSGEGAGVTVAVLADGVDARQADLSGRVITGPDFTGSKRAAGGKYYGVIGTGLASLIAGHGHGSNSARGIDGIASQARILSVRVTLSPGDPLWSHAAMTSRLPADIAAGIKYAVKHGVSVIALPADPGVPGIAGWGGVKAAAGGSGAEQAAIAYAIQRNVMLIAPAGDNAQAGDAPNYPAGYHGVIAVGAFDSNFVKAPYSSHQQYVSLTAAGRGVVAAAPSGYQTMNSTWAASAIVAGVASLVRSQFPELTAAQALQAMTHSAMYWRPDGLSNGSGYGAVNAAKALAEAAAMSPPHAKPAGHGALPRLRPATPSVPSNIAVISRNLLGDGFVSAAVLACLLVPIMWYGSIIKRRDRMVALAAADRAQHSMLGSGRRGMDDDPLLDFFGPQEAPAEIPAGTQRSLAGPRYQSRPALSGRSTLTPAFAPRPMLAAPHADVDHPDTFADGGAGHDRSDAWGDSGAWRSQPDRPAAGPGDRQPGQDQDQSRTLRHAPVSGTPPWEPAPQPTGELPWAVLSRPVQGSARHTGFGGAGAGEPPDESLWTTRSESQSAPPSPLFDPDPRQDASGGAGTGEGLDQEPDPDRRSDSDWRSISSRRNSSGERPIYIWDPDTADDDGIRLTSRYQD